MPLVPSLLRPRDVDLTMFVWDRPEWSRDVDVIGVNGMSLRSPCTRQPVDQGVVHLLGVLHALVRVDRGTDALRLRIEGPTKLDSGAFVRVRIPR